MRVMKRLAFNGKVRLSMARQLYSGPHSFFFSLESHQLGVCFNIVQPCHFGFFFKTWLSSRHFYQLIQHFPSHWSYRERHEKWALIWIFFGKLMRNMESQLRKFRIQRWRAANRLIGHRFLKFHLAPFKLFSRLLWIEFLPRTGFSQQFHV